MSEFNTQWMVLFKQKGIELKTLPEYLPIRVTSEEINKTKDVLGAKAKDARLLTKIDCREALPEIFKEHGLFLLPVRNGEFVILQGDGFCDIENLSTSVSEFASRLEFELESSGIGDSEMLHLDYAFNVGLLESHYCSGPLFQTVRGRKYSPPFTFEFNRNKIEVRSVQIEVDGGYESSTM